DLAEKGRDEAEMGRHGLMMTAAWQAWQQNDLTTAEEILREVPAPLQQTWEYRHVRRLCQRKAMTLRGHTGGGQAAAVRPGGPRLASGSDDGTLKVWDGRTGRDLLPLARPT